jgi:sigma-B regulation protein RsbU (phosphoserine phosphatase)
MKADTCELDQFRYEIDRSLAGHTASVKEAVIVNDVSADDRVNRELLARTGLDVRSLMAVPLIGKGRLIGVVEVLNKIDGDFDELDIDVMTGLNNQMAVAIDNAHLVRELRREALERKMLYDVGVNLAGALELEDLLKNILQSIARVVPYAAAGVFLIDPAEGDMEAIYSEGYSEEARKTLHVKMGQGLVGHVAKTGKGVIVRDVTVDPYYIESDPETKSEIVAPIKVGDRVVGVLNMESHQLGAYNDHSLALIQAFATHAAISLERARMHESMINAQKIEEQLNVARTIQRTFLPDLPPAVEGYDVHGRNVSSGEVGGDYFDYIRIVDQQYGLTIADVSGKGVPAALIMATFRASLIAEIRNNYSIRTICEKVNRLMVESVEPGNYVTAVYGVLDSHNHIFTYANCGHNHPFILRHDGSVVYLNEGGPILGVTAEGKFEEQALFLNPGDIIVMYTDGVTEVFDENGEEFGVERLVEVVRSDRKKSSAEVEQAIYSAVQKYAAPSHVFDDFTTLIARRV